MSQYDLAIVKTNEDFIILVRGYCTTCAVLKARMLKTFSIDAEEMRDLNKNHGIRVCRIKCECNMLDD